jgi:hypothetical protein
VNIPRECAELRADFIERALWPNHLLFMESMVRSSRMAGDGLFPYEWDGEQVANDMRHTMAMAEMWTATPEMQDLIVHAAESLPPQALLRESVPSQQGFLFLPKPLWIEDVRGERLAIRAIMWSEREIGREWESPGVGLDPVQRGLVIDMFALFGDKDDPLTKLQGPKRVGEIVATAPRLSLFHAMSVAFDQLTWDVDTSEVNGTPEEKAMLGRLAARSMHDGQPVERLADGRWRLRTGDGHLVKAKPDPIVQFLHAYFHFVGSELSALDREYLPRSSGRWLRRLGLDNSPITVVRLRRRAGSETGNGTALSYRHVRRGHWRKQWYGSGEGRYQQHIWIAPTIVGDDSLPLRVRDVVSVVAR